MSLDMQIRIADYSFLVLIKWSSKNWLHLGIINTMKEISFEKYSW